MDREAGGSQLRMDTCRASRGVKGDSALENSTKGHEGVMRDVLSRAESRTPRNSGAASARVNSARLSSARPGNYRPASSLDG